MILARGSPYGTIVRQVFSSSLSKLVEFRVREAHSFAWKDASKEKLASISRPAAIANIIKMMGMRWAAASSHRLNGDIR